MFPVCIKENPPLFMKENISKNPPENDNKIKNIGVLRVFFIFYEFSIRDKILVFNIGMSVTISRFFLTSSL